MTAHRTLRERAQEALTTALRRTPADGTCRSRFTEEEIESEMKALVEEIAAWCDTNEWTIWGTPGKAIRRRFLQPESPEEVALDALRNRNASDFAVKYPRDHEWMCRAIVQALRQEGWIRGGM